jgi:hypothetical protein
MPNQTKSLYKQYWMGQIKATAQRSNSEYISVFSCYFSIENMESKNVEETSN